MSRPELNPWRRPLCEREVLAVHMWKEHSDEGGECAIYIHTDNQRCFVINHSPTGSVSQIVDHGFLGKTPENSNG
jgi:hypothetical protein